MFNLLIGTYQENSEGKNVKSTITIYCEQEKTTLQDVFNEIHSKLNIPKKYIALKKNVRIYHYKTLQSYNVSFNTLITDILDVGVINNYDFETMELVCKT